MEIITCTRCGNRWPILEDGTISEHPQAEVNFLLCPGSRQTAEPTHVRKSAPPADAIAAPRRQASFAGEYAR